ncbi:MAG TPA: fasciclin domain-containing protein [Gemmatimonadales bacterium]
MSYLRTIALASALAVPGLLAAQEAQGYSESASPTVAGDIIETASAAGSFKTLGRAIEAAGLTETLKGEGPFTVFAPTDEAFAQLPKGTLEALLKDKAKLTAILTYHVVAGKVTSGQVAGMSSAKTLNGQELSIKAKDGKVKVGKSTVTTADIEASNGVIHVIDQVLMPK